MLLFLQPLFGQELPSRIRGYKVHNDRLTIAEAGSLKGRDPSTDIIVKLGDPVIAEMGLLSAVIEIGGEFLSARQKGRIDFLRFHDIKVNGIAVEVDEYAHAFAFEKQKWSRLDNPLRARISFVKSPKVLAGQLFSSQPELLVTGTAFAFGKFRRYGFGFKRVVPIAFELRIRNPLAASQ